MGTNKLSEEDLLELSSARKLKQEAYKLQQQASNIERGIFSRYRSEDTKYLTFDILRDIHEAIYDTIDLEDVSKVDLISEVMEAHEETFDTYTKSKHKEFPYEFGSKLFEHFLDHPVQKRLYRKGCVSKKGMKQSNTPSKHVEYVWGVKMNYLTMIELKKLREEFEKNKLEAKARMDNIEASVDTVKEWLIELSKQDSKLEKKVQAYLYRLEGMKHKDVAEIMNIGESTSRAYYNQVSELISQRNILA